jgi:LPXTG-motif cell wall-anchored protein
MACHGDQGQGLTDEWRGVLDIADQNCWQSKCHSPNHPPGGFVFPKFVPSVVGAGVVARFETAYDLYTFLKTEMPFQAPGSLKDEEYWQLTAFLLRINQLDPGSQTLDEVRAAQIPLRATLLPPQEPPEKTASEQAALIFLIVGAGLLVLVPALYYLRKRRRVKA